MEQSGLPAGEKGTLRKGTERILSVIPEKKLKIKDMISYFSLLKTKGSASFSLASRSVSDSRRLKVKLAVGSVYRNTKMTLSAQLYLFMA